MKSIENTREEINKIDKQMAGLFEERMKLARDVAAYKKEHGLPVFDPKREAEIKLNSSALIADGEIRPYYMLYLNAVMDISKKYQNSLIAGSKIAFCGEKGAFADIAVKTVFPYGSGVKFNSFKDAYNSVVSGDCDFAVLPIENSDAGEVGQVTDLLFSGELVITGIYDMPIDQNLLGVKGSNIKDIKTVISHPQALLQCSDYINNHNFSTVSVSSTSLAAKTVAEKSDKTLAAIANSEAADIFDLEILELRINSQRANTTRFATFSRSLSSAKTPSKTDKFILTFTVKNETGALAKAISIFASYGYNMRSLRSRPMKELLWSYYFYLEAEGDIRTNQGKKMLEELKDYCEQLKVAGIF